MKDGFVTPALTVGLFWFGSAGIAGSAFLLPIRYPLPSGYGFFVLFGAIFLILLLRVICEWIIIQFSIHETLTEIRDRLDPKRPTQPVRVEPTLSEPSKTSNTAKKQQKIEADLNDPSP